MAVRDLSSGKLIEIEPARGAPLEDGDLALVVLAGFELHSLYGHDGRRAGRSDRTRRRWKDVEGFLRFDVSGQETQLAWSASVAGRREDELTFRLKDPEKLGGRLLYFGRPDGVLDLDVSLLESDAGARKRLSSAGRVVDFVSDAAGPVPGLGTAVAGSLDLFRAVLDFARKNELDDLELRALTSLGDAASAGGESTLRSGRYTLRRRRAATRATDFELGLDVVPIAPPARKTRSVVILESLELDLASPDDDHVFAFEAAVGSGRGQRTLSFAEPLSAGARGDLENVLAVRGWRLFSGSAAEGIPFRLQFATLRNKKRAKEVVSLLGAGARFAGSLLEAEERSVLTRAAKTADGVASFLIDAIPEKSSQGRVEGVIGLGAPKGDVPSERRVVLLGGTAPGWRHEEIVVGAGDDLVRVRLRIGNLD